MVKVGTRTPLGTAAALSAVVILELYLPSVLNPLLIECSLSIHHGSGMVAGGRDTKVNKHKTGSSPVELTTH